MAKKKAKASGKRARAKAKLDRQWGEEEADNDPSRVYRRGFSKHNDQRKKKRVAVEAFSSEGDVFQNQANVSTGNFSSDDEDDLSDDNNNPLRNLLGKIRSCRNTKDGRGAGRSRGNEKVSKSNLSDEESKELHSKSDVEDDKNGAASDTNDEDENLVVIPDALSTDDEDEDRQQVQRKDDLYANHFSRQPLNDDEVANFSSNMGGDKLVLRKFSAGTKYYAPMTDVENLKLFATGPINDILSNEDGVSPNCKALLRLNWPKFNRGNISLAGNDTSASFFTPLQSLIYSSLSNYADLLVTTETRENRNEMSDVTILHILNHVLTARKRIQRHNQRIRELAQNKSSESGALNSKKNSKTAVQHAGNDDKWRDQGFTQPKVLILCPTRGTALDFVMRMLNLPGSLAYVSNLQRFQEDFGVSLDNDDVDADARRQAVLRSKGADWQELFGDDVNDDDDFKIGLSVSPKPPKGKKDGEKIGIQVYNDFLASDIIVASPLSLKIYIEQEDANADFLSSIEICAIFHSDVLMMQNWDHVLGTLSATNQQPKKTNETDFSRVRNYALAGQSMHWRQLIVFSKFNDACIQGTFKRHAKSIEGRVRLVGKVEASEASVCDVLLKVKQVFQRVPCNTLSAQGESKLKYFADKVLPQILRLKQKHTLIYIPSYFDFVSVRNILLKAEANFVSVTEYARVSEVSRGRSRFQQGRKNIMLYTGRCHFFKRHIIKGARHLIFFGLPEHAEFYSGMVNVLNDMGKSDSLNLEAQASCLCLFTKYDAHALERIVGTSHCGHMLKSEKTTFLFCS